MVIVVVSMILIISGIIILLTRVEEFFSFNYFITFSAILLILTGFILVMNLHVDGPTAIDVYRGKTTLQITYKDSIPVDSVVVFKNK